MTRREEKKRKEKKRREEKRGEEKRREERRRERREEKREQRITFNLIDVDIPDVGELMLASFPIEGNSSLTNNSWYILFY